MSSLKALPLNCPIRFVSDALSAIQSISRPLLASGRRIRLGARSLVLTAMDFVGLRRSAGGSTGFDHVHSHTEGEDLWSKGNAAADREADAASADQSETSVTERESRF